MSSIEFLNPDEPLPLLSPTEIRLGLGEAWSESTTSEPGPPEASGGATSTKPGISRGPESAVAKPSPLQRGLGLKRDARPCRTRVFKHPRLSQASATTSTPEPALVVFPAGDTPREGRKTTAIDAPSNVPIGTYDAVTPAVGFVAIPAAAAATAASTDPAATAASTDPAATAASTDPAPVPALDSVHETSPPPPAAAPTQPTVPTPQSTVPTPQSAVTTPQPSLQGVSGLALL